MGKKERDIKRQNTEFYKDYNKDVDKEFREYAKQVAAEDDKVNAQIEAEDKREAFAVAVADLLNDHASSQALDLNVSNDNMLNYIYFFQECKYAAPRSAPPAPPPVVVQTAVVESKCDMSGDPEILDLIRRMVIDSGEANILVDYLNEYENGKIPIGRTCGDMLNELRDELVKIHGKKEWYRVVEIAGTNNYNRVRHKLGL
jgi:hypothetical protein